MKIPSAQAFKLYDFKFDDFSLDDEGSLKVRHTYDFFFFPLIYRVDTGHVYIYYSLVRS